QIIRDELIKIKEKFNDERRTEIAIGGADFFEDEDLIPEENIIITLTNQGYIKRLPLSTYRTQNRGAPGVQGIGTHQTDFGAHPVSTSTHETIIIFTKKRKVYRFKGYEMPELGRAAKGLPIINLLQIEKDERINTVISVNEFTEDQEL